MGRIRAKCQRSLRLPAAGHLVFPQCRDENKSLRVSEREAMFAFVEALCQRPFGYAVESLAGKLYGFTGQKPF